MLVNDYLTFSFNDLCNDMKVFMERRKNSEVHFAAYIDKEGREHDITMKVREEIG